MRQIRAAGRAAVVLFFLASTAQAQTSPGDRENARAMWADGQSKRAQGDHKGALRSFEAAHALMALPATGIEVAKEREAAGLLIEARDMALSVAKMAAVTPDDERIVAEAAALYRRLDPRIPSIEVVVAGLPPNTRHVVRIDGGAIPEAARSLPWRVNPGTHTVAVGARGYRVGVRTLTVPEATKARAEITMTPLAEPTAATAQIPAPAAPPPPLQLFIRSSDPTVGVYDSGTGDLLCLATCATQLDAPVGSLYFAGVRTPPSKPVSLSGLSGAWSATVEPPSRTERDVGWILTGLGAAAGLVATAASFVMMDARDPNTGQTAAITTTFTGLSSLFLVPIGIGVLVSNRTTVTLSPIAAP
ncbi:MAG: hypothetical protein R3B70_45940 [Polyangiaceae bacterium]